LTYRQRFPIRSMQGVTCNGGERTRNGNTHIYSTRKKRLPN
jgi:hypothetical protein